MSNSLYNLEQVMVRINNRILLDIDELEIKKGGRYRVVGPNGAGKTTLLKLLNGLVRINFGRLLYLGSPFSEVMQQIRNETIFVHQQPFAFSMTVFDNVALGLRIAGVPEEEVVQRVKTALGQLKIEAIAQRYARHLSGGELQKCAIARAVVLDKEVYFFDEPISYLDGESVLVVKSLIEELHTQKNKTIVYTTHHDLGLDERESLIYIENAKLRQGG